MKNNFLLPKITNIIKVIINNICIVLIIFNEIRFCRFKWSINNDKIRIRPKNEYHISHIWINVRFEHSILLSSIDWLKNVKIVKLIKMIA